MTISPQAVNNQIVQTVEALQAAPGQAFTPAKMAILLAKLEELTNVVDATELISHMGGAIADPAHEILRADLDRWRGQLSYYKAQVAAAPANDAAAISETVTSPLLFGVCYGAPSCSDNRAAAWAPGGFPITPTMHTPFIVLNAAKSVEEGTIVQQFLTAFGDTLTDYWEGAKKVAASALPDLPKLEIPVWAYVLVGVLGVATVVALLRR